MKRIILVIFVSFISNTYAGITKWVDENNQVHYSDQPPPGITSKKSLVNSLVDTPTQTTNEIETGDTKKTEEQLSSEPKTIAEREIELKKTLKEKQEAADKSAKEQANQKNNLANCNNAKISLKGLQSGMRMMDIDMNGERFYLDDMQRQQRISDTQEDINRLCK